MTLESLDSSSYVQLGALILAALGAVTYLAMRKPMAGLLVWVGVFPFQLDTACTIGFRFAPADIALVGLLLAFAIRAWRGRTSVPGMDGVLRASLLLLAWLVVASGHTLLSAGTIPQYVLLNKLLGLASLIASYWLMKSLLPTVKRASQALRWYCSIGTLWNLAGLAAFGSWKWAGSFKPMIFAPGWEDRLRGMLVDPNAYAGYLVSVTLVQLCLVATSTSSERPVLGVVNSGLLLLGLGLADSRSAWLALICGVAVLVLHLSLAERRRLLGPGLLLGVVALTFLWLSFGASSSYELEMRSRALGFRFDLTLAAFDAFASSPVWGTGVGDFHLRGSYIVHSTYLWLLAESGLIGLLLFFYVVVRAFSVGRSALRVSDERARLLGLTGVAILGGWLGLMVGVEALYQRHYWFLCAAAGAVPWATRQRPGPESSTPTGAS